MDELRNERQKESIDDILSDLNNLLNRMPAILEGIKLPNMDPIDFLSPRMPEPASADATAVFYPESAPEPAQPVQERVKPSEPEAEDEAEQTFDSAVNPLVSRGPETTVPEEPQAPAPPALEEHMFAQSAPPEPSTPDAPPVLNPEDGSSPVPGQFPPAAERSKLPEPWDVTGEQNSFNMAAAPEVRTEQEAAPAEELPEPAPPSSEEPMPAQSPRPEPEPALTPEYGTAPVPEAALPPVSDLSGLHEAEAAAEEPREPAPPALEEHMFAQEARPEPFPVIMPEPAPEPVPEQELPPVVEREELPGLEAPAVEDHGPTLSAGPEERAEQEAAAHVELSEPALPSLEEPAYAQISAGPEPAPNLPSEPQGSDPGPRPQAEAPAESGGKAPEVKKAPVYDLEAVKKEAEAIEKAFKRGPEKEEDEKAAPLFETTHDFGVPDIDTLIRLSKTGAAPLNRAVPPEEEPEKQEEPFPVIEPAAYAQIQPEPVLKPAAFTEAAPESQYALEADLDEIIISPRAGSAEGEGEVMDIQNENPGKFEPEKPDRPAPEVVDAAAPRLELPTPQDFTLRSNAPASEEPGFVIKQTNLEMDPNPPAAPSDDTAAIEKEEERTGIFTTVSAAGPKDEIGPIADKPVPDGIPPERVRTVAFLYAAEDTDLCADVLNELDAICLKSASKPMFIKRAFVQTFSPEINGNMYLQKVSEAGAMGLICLGNIPKDSVYDMENIFNAGVTFFRHFSREAFTRSAVLDLISELMLK